MKTRIIRSKKIKSRYSYRVNANLSRIEKINNRLNLTGAERTKMQGILTKGKGLHTKGQLRRIRNIEKKIKNGKFNIKYYISRESKYIENKGYLNKNISVSELLKSLDRSEFYYENRDDIVDYNTAKGGKKVTKGKVVSNSYNSYKDRLDNLPTL